MLNRFRIKFCASALFPLLIALLLVGCSDSDATQEKSVENTEEISRHDAPENNLPKINLIDKGETTSANKETSTVNETPAAIDRCSREKYDNAPVSGRFWRDGIRLGLTEVVQGIADPESDAIGGVANAPVSLVLPGAKRVDTTTCADGRFYFDNNDLAGNKVGIIDYHNTSCTTSNCPHKLAELAGKRPIKVVTFGDSIPSWPRGEKWFPEFLPWVAMPVAEIDSINVAIPGTRTYEWLPGTPNFEERIRANKDADIFIFSLGGNNVLKDSYLKLLLSMAPARLSALIKKAEAHVTEAFEEGRQIIDEIKKIAPQAEILWVSYMDYTKSFKTLNGLAMSWKKQEIARFMTTSSVQMRKMIAGYKGTLTLDMFGMSQQPHPDGSTFVNEDYLLWDGIHLNRRGHYFYAAQVFRALGGFFVGEKMVGEEENPDNQNIFNNLGTYRTVGYPYENPIP